LGSAFIGINIGISTLVTISGFLWNRLCGQKEATYLPEMQEDCCAEPEKTDLTTAGKTAFKQFWDIAAKWFAGCTRRNFCAVVSVIFSQYLRCLIPGASY